MCSFTNHNAKKLLDNLLEISTTIETDSYYKRMGIRRKYIYCCYMVVHFFSSKAWGEKRLWSELNESHMTEKVLFLYGITELESEHTGD